MQPASPIEDALRRAVEEFIAIGEVEFYGRHAARGTQLAVIHGFRLNAAALADAAFGRSAPDLGRTADDELIAATLRGAGIHVAPAAEWTVEDELIWRLDAWRAAERQGGIVSPQWIRNRGIYRASQGIFADKARTKGLADEGAAVAVLHTGRHYADDMDDHMIVYHFPYTLRPGSRDANEVQAVTNAMDLHLPVFVLADLGPGTRSIRLGWVAARDDSARAFLMQFGGEEPARPDLSHDEHAPFTLTMSRRRSARRQIHTIRDPEFKFRLLRRYGGRCAITSLGVPEVLDGAHVVPVEKGGTDDERNGLLLTANLHRAFDANLWALHPKSLGIVVRGRGPSPADLQITSDRLREGALPPHRDALEWRYERFLRAWKDGSGSAQVSPM